MKPPAEDPEMRGVHPGTLTGLLALAALLGLQVPAAGS